MVDTDRIDDTFWFLDYAREAADEFASVTENTNALHFPRTIESWGEEIPNSVGRPGWGVIREPEEGRGERRRIGKNKVDTRNDALWSRTETLYEDTTLAKGLLVNCFAVGQALEEGLLETGTMGTRGSEFDLFDDGDLTVEA